MNLILHWGPPKVWVLGDGGGCFIPQGSREWWGLAREGAPWASAHVSPRPTSPQRPQWAERRPPVHAPPRSALRQSGPPPSLSANSWLHLPCLPPAGPQHPAAHPPGPPEPPLPWGLSPHTRSAREAAEPRAGSWSLEPLRSPQETPGPRLPAQLALHPDTRLVPGTPTGRAPPAWASASAPHSARSELHSDARVVRSLVAVPR